MKLSKEELYNTKGGGSWFSASLGTWIIDIYKYIVDLGRYVGSSLSRIVHNTRC